jgi:hypothetical protein
MPSGYPRQCDQTRRRAHTSTVGRPQTVLQTLVFRPVLGVLSLALLAAPAAAQVLEPNGVAVPQPGPEHETSLQSFMDAAGETIDVVVEASAEPGVFSPLCDFEAALVLSESQAQAGIAWYNVPTDPNAAPESVYLIVPPTAQIDEVISSADIRSHPEYAGGKVGFVLMKDEMRVYYSEAERNAYCSACTTPGYWAMTLAYRSTLDPNAYYLAFEDWEGANASDWGGNDGDFNDKVFRISGVVCIGGGVPCDTGLLGVCSVGLTECLPGGELACRPQIPASSEVCDNLDNDCNGLVDDGEGLCPVGEVCYQGKCQPTCAGTEFPCQSPLICDIATGICVHPACVDVQCDIGQVCVAGTCVGGCEGVVCPIGQQCLLGRCVTLCENVECPIGEVCENGVCVVSCECVGCTDGQVCAPSGKCVDAGCETLSCGAAEACVDGACVDVCLNAVCPGGAECVQGACGQPSYDGAAGSGSDEPAPEVIVVDPPETGSGEAGGSGGTGATRSPNAAGGDTAAQPGCGCRIEAKQSRAAARSAWWIALPLWLWCRRSRRARSALPPTASG